MPQSQTAALPRPQEEEETDKSKQILVSQFLYTMMVHLIQRKNFRRVKYEKLLELDVKLDK